MVQKKYYDNKLYIVQFITIVFILLRTIVNLWFFISYFMINYNLSLKITKILFSNFLNCFIIIII